MSGGTTSTIPPPCSRTRPRSSRTARQRSTTSRPHPLRDQEGAGRLGVLEGGEVDAGHRGVGVALRRLEVERQNGPGGGGRGHVGFSGHGAAAGWSCGTSCPCSAPPGRVLGPWWCPVEIPSMAKVRQFRALRAAGSWSTLAESTLSTRVPGCRFPRQATARRLRGVPREKVPPASRGRRALISAAVPYAGRREGSRHRIRCPRARHRPQPRRRPGGRRRVVAPGNPGMDVVALCEPLPGGLLDGEGVADLAASPRRRPRRHRARGAARGRCRRRGARGGLRGVRPVRRGGPARGQQGVRQGGDGSRRRPDRPWHACAAPSRRWPTPSTPSAPPTWSRTTGSPQARASS